MPDMKTGKRERGPQDLVKESLEAVRRDDEVTEVPPHLEGLVMRAWDTGAGVPAEERRGLSHAFWFAAAAATVMLAVAVSMQRGDRTENPEDTTTNQSAIEDSVAGFAENTLESLVTVDVVLDEDPALLQYVQMSVEPSVLAAIGFPVRDPADDQPVEVEVLVGLDGVPRAIRHANFVQG